jgi:hypothetical protein
MLSNSKQVALKYTKTPYLIAVSEDPHEEIYFVPDSALPALDIGNCDIMSYVSPEELFFLKKKYRIPNSLIRKIRKCYSENNEEFDIGDDISLEKSLFISDFEDRILQRIKQQYRNESANFWPYYPVHEMGVRTFHTAVVGSSSVGKSYTVAKIIEKNFKNSIVYVFSPTAKKDKAWLDLQKTLGKRVKLINSNEVDTEIPLSEIAPGSCTVIDDIDATQDTNGAKTYICRLQSRLLFEGRHHVNPETGIGCQVFSILHDAWQVGNAALKSCNIESSRVIVFPNLNRSICSKYWSKKLHWTSKEIKAAFKWIRPSDRWACVYTHVPACIVTSHGVCLL